MLLRLIIKEAAEAAVENCAVENCAAENCAAENCAAENCAAENCALQLVPLHTEHRTLHREDKI